MNLCYAEFRRITERESEAAAFFSPYIEFTADWQKGRDTLLVQMFYKGKVIWGNEMPVSQLQVETTMSDDEFTETITRTMRDHLNIVAQMYFTKIEALFPNAVEKVDLQHDKDRGVRRIAVTFKNGFVADCDEAEVKSQEFLARCTMLYDLPRADTFNSVGPS